MAFTCSSAMRVSTSAPGLRAGRRLAERHHDPGRSPSAITLAHAPPITASCRRCRFRFGDFPLRRWPRPRLRCLTFPVAVILYRFFIPLWVFCFGMILCFVSRSLRFSSALVCRRGASRARTGSGDYKGKQPRFSSLATWEPGPQSYCALPWRGVFRPWQCLPGKK